MGAGALARELAGEKRLLNLRIPHSMNLAYSAGSTQGP